MPKKQTQFTFRYIFYKYDVSNEQDGSEAEYEVLHTEILNNGFWIPDTSWLDDEVHHVDLGEFVVCQELAMAQVHEIVVNVEPWSEYDAYNGDWDGGVHWHDVAHRRITGQDLKDFLICYPRCNRLQGMSEDYDFELNIGSGGIESMKWEMACDAVPEELRKLTDKEQDAMFDYMKSILKRYYMESE